VTRFLDTLVKKDFINRKKGKSQDARERNIFPTQKAKDIEEKLELKGDELYQKMIDKIEEPKLVLLVEQLRHTRQEIR
jgi:DNA-binding MarR family transcriptional regulator